MKTEVPSLLKTQVEYLCVEYESKLMMLKMTEFIKMYYFQCITNSCKKKIGCGKAHLHAVVNIHTVVKI